MYPTPKILNYSQTFGFTLGCFISIQILSGICLSSFFCDLSNINSKFFFINIFDNTEYGFFIQKLHSVGVYAIFCLLTIHILKNIYAYNIESWLVWLSGFLIFVSTIVTAFTGYVLPWGQMSYWGVVVITNFLSVIPYIGTWLVTFIWGGTVISNRTLCRFYMFHYIATAALVGVIILHFLSLHFSKTSTINKSKTVVYCRYKNLYSGLLIKDLVTSLFCFFLLWVVIIFYSSLLEDSINLLPALPIVTPKAITPEPYFLLFYSILKLINNKGFGLFLLVLFICTPILYVLNKKLSSSYKSSRAFIGLKTYITSHGQVYTILDKMIFHLFINRREVR